MPGVLRAEDSAYSDSGLAVVPEPGPGEEEDDDEDCEPVFVLM